MLQRKSKSSKILQHGGIRQCAVAEDKEVKPDMVDKCHRYVADPNIGCLSASCCGAIAYGEKII